MKKGSSISMTILGVLFIALGVILFLIQNGSIVVTIIAALDVIFGVFLIAGNHFPRNNASDQPSDTWSMSAYEADRSGYPGTNSREQSVSSYEETSAYERTAGIDVMPNPEAPSLPNPEEMSVSELAAREGEFRAAARESAEKAVEAKRIASEAVQDAKQADAELRRAEAELANLDPIHQRSAMREIDSLAQIAAQKSKIAVQSAQAAKAAIGEARAAAELHNKAMDAAAAAIAGDDEFADFN